jgi:hypothetical protein
MIALSSYINRFILTSINGKRQFDPDAARLDLHLSGIPVR